MFVVSGKKIVFRALCNNFTGRIITAIYRDKIPDLRWRKFRFSTAGTGMKSWVEASIFWGFYEGAEIRFIEKYFNGDTDVLELGASSGIVSAHIITKMKTNYRLVSVEANKHLTAVWTENTKRHNVNGIKLELLNAAIYYHGDTVMFDISSDTTESKLAGPDNDTGTEVPAMKLGSIVSQYGLKEYSLFSDIEGAELDILLNGDEALSTCRHIFIELHDAHRGGRLYTADELVKIIENKGFRLVDRYGNVCFFTRSALMEKNMQ